MCDDIRVLPFTDEEKARLNEKVQKMKFSRPPPKLPKVRVPRKTAVHQEEGAVVHGSSGKFPGSPTNFQHTSHGSFSDLSDQAYQLSCSKYVCDGDDWIQDSIDQDSSTNRLDDIHGPIDQSHPNVPCLKEEQLVESIDITESTKDLSSFNSCDSKATYDHITTHVSSINPVQLIDATSPIVYSQGLESTLNRKRGDLLGIASRVEERIGKFENPTYGRLLLTKNFPVESMKYIMQSAIENLISYFNTQKLKPMRVSGKSRTAISASNVKTASIKIKKGTKTIPKGTKMLKKAKGENKSNVGTNRKSTKSQKSSKIQSSTGNTKKKRARKLSIVSTTSEGTKKSFKIVIRRDLPLEDGYAVTENQISSTTQINSIDNMVTSAELHDGVHGIQNVQVDDLLSPTMACQTNLTQYLRHDSEDVKNIEIKRDLEVHDGNLLLNSIDNENDDVVIVHEAIRSTTKKPFWNRLTVEESSLVFKLATLLKTNLSDINESNWFEELYRKAQQFANHLDSQLNMYYEKKLELSTWLGSRIAERNRCRSLFQSQKYDRTAQHDNSFDDFDTITPAILSKYPQMGSAMKYSTSMRVSSDGNFEKQCMEAANGGHIDICNSRSQRMQWISSISEPTMEETPKVDPIRISVKRQLSSFPYDSSACIKMRGNSLSRIIDKLSSPPEDIPRDPTPSSCIIPTRQDVLNMSENPTTPYEEEPLLMKPTKSYCVTSPQDLTAVVPFEMPLSLTTTKRPQDTRVIAKRISEFSKPRYIFKNGMCYERKYEIAPTERLDYMRS